MHNQKHQQPTSWYNDIIPSTYANFFIDYHEWIEHGNNGQATTSNFTSKLYNKFITTNYQILQPDIIPSK